MKNLKLEVFLKRISFIVFAIMAFSLIAAVIYALVIINGILFTPALLKEQIWGLSICHITLMLVASAVISYVILAGITKITKFKIEIRWVG